MVSNAISGYHLTLHVGVLLDLLQAVALAGILPRHSVHKIEEVFVCYLDATGFHSFHRVTLEAPV